jgi:hypothetical protein
MQKNQNEEVSVKFGRPIYFWWPRLDRPTYPNRYMIMIPAPGINGSDRTREGVCQALIPTVHRKSTVTMFSPSSGQSHRDASATHGGATRRRGHGRRPAAQSTNQRFQSPQEGQSEGCREGLTGHRCCETVRHAVQRHGDHNQVPTRNCPSRETISTLAIHTRTSSTPWRSQWPNNMPQIHSESRTQFRRRCFFLSLSVYVPVGGGWVLG